MPMRRTLLASIVAYLLFAFAAPVLVSAGIGVSPGNIINETLGLGNVFKQDITISQSDPKEPLDIKVDVDVPGATEWFSFTPGTEFTIPAGQKVQTIQVVVTVPEDAALSTYTGAIRITAVPAASTTGNGVSVTKGAKLDVSLTTTNQPYSSLLVRSMDISDAGEGEQLKLTLRVENKGNMDDAPSKVTIDIQDLNQQTLKTIELTEFAKVPVSETQEISASFTHELPVSEYFGLVKVYAGDQMIREERLNFKVSASNVGQPVNTVDDLSDSNRVVLIALVIGIVAVLSVILYRIASRLRNKNQAYVALVAALVLVSGGFMYAMGFTPSQAATEKVNGLSSDRSQLEVSTVRVAPSTVETEVVESTGYKLYAAPDRTSAVLYTAQEGEDFPVVAEESDWYKVTTPAGQEAWLSKGDVVAAN